MSTTPEPAQSGSKVKHPKWCPRNGEPANISHGHCSTCGEKVR